MPLFAFSEVEMETAVNTYLPVDSADSFIVEAETKKLKELY